MHVDDRCYIEVKAWRPDQSCRERVLLDARPRAVHELDAPAIIARFSEALLQDGIE